jgi:hypothetical protein
MSRMIQGVAAGAVGTSLLNAVTYLDMAIRGRPSSSVPAEDVEKLTGGHLGADEATASARTEGLGALLGFVTGFAGGAVLGLVRPAARAVPWPVAAALTGIGVMIATDGASVALGSTDPRSWAPADWAADVVPHLAYGAGAVLTFDALER